jgi:hypothetical protein
MNFDLQIITPRAIEWADQHASRILDMGEPLVEKDLALARRVGVAKPEKIRLLFVMQLPLPTDQLLRDVALENGLLGPSMIGLTLLRHLHSQWLQLVAPAVA